MSGYLTSFRAGSMRMHGCLCNAAPGLVQELEMSDIATLIAPRPILFESGTKDPLCPIKATREATHRAGRNYRILGGDGRIESDIFRGEHRWSGRKLRSFLSRWL